MRGGLRGRGRSCVGISKQVVRMLPRSKQRLLFEMDFLKGVLTGRRAIGLVGSIFGPQPFLGANFVAFFWIYDV